MKWIQFQDKKDQTTVSFSYYFYNRLFSMSKNCFFH